MEHETSYEFKKCASVTELPNIGVWDTSNIDTFRDAFKGCKSLEKLPDSISNWNTSKIDDMSSMFEGCEKLKELPDISRWNTEKMQSHEDMFKDCKLIENIIPEKFKNPKE